VTVTLKGAAELAACLQQMPDTAAVKAQRTGLSKGANRLRTYIRRAAPRKSGKLRNAIRSALSRKKLVAYVKLGKIRGESKIRFYYKTIEYGRKAHMRGPPKKGIVNRLKRAVGRGKYPVAASPQMATNFFGWAFVHHKTEIAQLVVSETRVALFKNAGTLAARLNAPLKVRRGR
jgi:hypothetical protein